MTIGYREFAIGRNIGDGDDGNTHSHMAGAQSWIGSYLVKECFENNLQVKQKVLSRVRFVIESAVNGTVLQK